MKPLLIVLFLVFAIMRLSCAITASSHKLARHCTASTIGEVESLKSRNEEMLYQISFDADGEIYEGWICDALSEGLSKETKTGTEVRVWYNPDDPNRFIVCNRKDRARKLKTYESIKALSIKGMVICAALIIFLFIAEKFI